MVYLNCSACLLRSIALLSATSPQLSKSSTDFLSFAACHKGRVESFLTIILQGYLTHCSEVAVQNFAVNPLMFLKKLNCHFHL